ncbi:hypothetical protein E4V42_17705 [Clostridium estertheticum]|uniref:Bacterial Ig-like domain-containing protein n=1 Tax=Clostridium estertheticum TaxID=238834 RepID=A0A5N7ISK8_9CLOT|nr:hypothetical protein [Clostridium estertheticum]MPQ33261.1 hypothetical protein [Clostridium estertheticum]MPQ63919.1 hypothetical protein [Clostridium estertheticum]
MKKFKSVMMMGFVLLTVTLSKPAMAMELSSFNDVPDFAVVIGDSMYTLEYANDLKNISLINDAVVKNKGDIFIKTDDSGWIKNSNSTQVNKDSVNISTIKYNNGQAIVASVPATSNVTKIQIDPTITKTGTNTATFTYKILDQNGLDITKTIPASDIYGSVSVGSTIVVDPTTGIGTITFNSSADISKSIIITLVNKTGVTGTSAPSKIAGFSINPITTKTGMYTATFKYSVINSVNEDITKTVPASQLTVTSSDKSIIVLNPSTATGTITYNSTIDLNSSISITLKDLLTSITVSSVMVAPVVETNASKVNKISVTSTVLGVIGDKGYALYVVYDQYGNDITNTLLGNNVTFQSNIGQVQIKNGLLTITVNSGINLKPFSSVIITGYDSISKVTTSATLTVATQLKS